MFKGGKSMGNHRPGSDDGLFHFQLDMPDKKPQPKAPSGSSAGRAQGSVQPQSGYTRGSQSVNRTSQSRPASSGTYTGTSAGRTRSAATSGSRAAGPRSAASGARTAGTYTARSAASGSRTVGTRSGATSGARTTGTRSTAASGARTAGTYTTRSAGARPGGTRTSGGRTGTGTRTARDGMRNSQQRPGPVRRRRSAPPKTAGYTGYFKAAGGGR